MPRTFILINNSISKSYYQIREENNFSVNKQVTYPFSI